MGQKIGRLQNINRHQEINKLLEIVKRSKTCDYKFSISLQKCSESMTKKSLNFISVTSKENYKSRDIFQTSL